MEFVLFLMALALILGQQDQIIKLKKRVASLEDARLQPDRP